MIMMAEEGLAALDESVLEELASSLEEAERDALERLSAEVKKLKDVAVADRAQSGIEQHWRYCDAVMQNEDAGLGGQQSGANWYKPLGPDGRPIMKAAASCASGRSKGFINVTKSPVRFAAWAVKEMALPLGGELWHLKRTPEDLAAAAENVLVRQMPEEMQSQVLLELRTLETELLKKAEQKIKDMLVEGPETLEDLAVKVFDAAADKGTGVWQGPIPLAGKAGVKPAFRFVPVDLLYPDPACGGDVKNGGFVFEGPEVKSAKELRACRKEAQEGTGGWILPGLEKVLEEGVPAGQTGYEFWYFEGEVPLSIVVPFLPGRDKSDAQEHIWISCILCNETVVRVSEALLDGEITYHVLKWDSYRRIVGDRWIEYWAGRGMTVDLESVQRFININWRSIEDNGQLSAVPQIVMWKGVLEPANKRIELEPGKFWWAKQKFGEEAFKEVKSAIMSIDIPCRIPELRENIPFGLSMIPQITGIDDVVRGVAPGRQVGTMQVQLNASSHLAKRVTFYWQQMFKEAIKCAISYLRQYGGLPFTPVPEIVPPPTQIVRDVQASSLVQALGLAVNPLYGQDPKLLFEQWLQANQFDPSRTELSPERLAQLQQLSQPQPDEKALATLESAKVRAEANVQAAAVDAGAKQQQTALNAENEARKREHERAMKEMDYKMRLLEYASQRQIDLQMAAAEMGAAGGEESETTSNTAK